MNNGPIRDDMSAMWDWGPHDVSMILDILEKYPQSVQAWGVETLRPGKQLYDTVFIKLNFARGVTAAIHNSWLSPTKRQSLAITGEKPMIVYDDVAEKKVIVHTSGKITYPRYSSTVSPLEEELKAFLAMIKNGKTPPSDLKNGLDVVRVLASAEKSIRRGGALVQL